MTPTLSGRSVVAPNEMTALYLGEMPTRSFIMMHSRCDALRGASHARINARQRSFGTNGLSRPPLLFLHTTRLTLDFALLKASTENEQRAKPVTELCSDLKIYELTYSTTTRTASGYPARRVRIMPSCCPRGAGKAQ